VDEVVTCSIGSGILVDIYGSLDFVRHVFSHVFVVVSLL
jgi:hypothetical protein